VKLSECGLKTETKLMTFCECGKKIIMIRRSGMLSKINGRKATVVRKGIGNNGLDSRMDTSNLSK